LNRPAKVLVALLLALIAILSVELRLTARAAHDAASDDRALGRVRWLAQEERAEWRNAFLGVSILQYPNDLMTYQRVLFDVKPDIVIETGTAAGGLTLYLAMLLENINEAARVLSVDVQEKNGDAVLASASIRQSLKDRIRFFQGSSTDPNIVGQMAALAKGKKVVVILDSLHLRAHVQQELELYAPLVPPGGYIIVNDTFLTGTTWLPPGDGGSGQAVREFLKVHPEFKVTTSQPDFVISCFPSGILARVR
jgi:cephalosporin hydroxylase